MAIMTNVWLRGAKKRMGGAVLYQQAGRTLARELAAEVSNPRTNSQMQQRVKWANLVSFYRSNRLWMARAFETKKATQSDYNKLMSLNVASSHVYLTKQQAAAGACVVAAYKVTEGSLPPVEVYEVDGGFGSSLYVGDAEPSTTVGAWSKALLDNNAGLRLGDQISLIRITQTSSNITGVPYIQVRAYEMLLDPLSLEPITNYMPSDIFSAVEIDGSYTLGVTNNGNAGAFTWVVSRSQGGRLQVSTQTLTLVNMEVFLEEFTSQTQLERAIQSYGESDEVFLDNANANYKSDEPTSLAIIGMSSDGVALRPGEYVGPAEKLRNKPFEMTFNKPIEGTIEVMYVDTEGPTLTASGYSKVGTKIVATSLTLSGAAFSGAVRTIRAIIGGVTYEWGFPISSDLS